MSQHSHRGAGLMQPCLVLLVVLFVTCFGLGAIECNIWK